MIEPLKRKESALVNSVADATRLAARLNRPEVRAIADFYHRDRRLRWHAEKRVRGGMQVFPSRDDHPAADTTARSPSE